jgi:putative hemolysin
MKSIYAFVTLIVALFLIGCAGQQKTSSTNKNPVLIDNAAYLKCTNEGGLDKIVYNADGRMDLCLFNDGSVCEQRALFDGSCIKGGCMRKCEFIGSRAEGWYDCHGIILFYDLCANETAATAGTC